MLFRSDELPLVINSGSSSIKFRLVDVVEGAPGRVSSETELSQGAVKGIGGVATIEVTGRDGQRSTSTLGITDHTCALHKLFDRLTHSVETIEAVGHRVVH